MRITIEDLEALKELSDELEENHVDTEKALQEDISEQIVIVYGAELLFIWLNRRERHGDPQPKTEDRVP